ncbi:MAG: glycosyltransferase family A protein [Syntrophomonadaceae bacterium]|nr:glycosyltransferase family A protein [Syntrophomonadaceae bacterium]
MSYKYLFTVFTPAYNRRHTLHRVYDSLKSQTFRDFEWLIVDDGSTDGTLDLVDQLKQEAAFPVRYFYQDNSGKHVAINRAVREAEGELFVIFDSDDSCTPEALERFKYHWEAIPEDRRAHFSGVTCHCVDQRGQLIGNSFPLDVLDSDHIEIQVKYKSAGEKWGFNLTDILKEFPFPEISGERFITEAVVWNRIAQKYKRRFVNDKLRIFYHTPDGLSALSVMKRAKSPCGARLYYQESAALPVPAGWKARSLLNYIRFSFHAGLAVNRIVAESGAGLLTTLLLPAGCFFYIRDMLTIKKIN